MAQVEEEGRGGAAEARGGTEGRRAANSVEDRDGGGGCCSRFGGLQPADTTLAIMYKYLYAFFFSHRESLLPRSGSSFTATAPSTALGLVPALLLFAAK